MKYRIFTNDRAAYRGVPMYSAYEAIEASSPEAALAEVRNKHFGEKPFAPMVAIEWPPITKKSKDWLKKHVGAYW
jgi:hypothetical protein